MAISAKLELRQSQQLVMTPQLQQAIKLLQLSNLELADFVATELERNPLLERDETSDRPVASSERSNQEAAKTSDGDPSASDEWVDTGRGASEAASALDTDYDNIYPDTSASDMGGAMAVSLPDRAGRPSRGAELPAVARIQTSKPTSATAFHCTITSQSSCRWH